MTSYTVHGTYQVEDARDEEDASDKTPYADVWNIDNLHRSDEDCARCAMEPI